MNEQKLMDGIKQIVSNHYIVLKEAYEEAKFEIGIINQQLTLFNNFLNMVKKPSDFYKKSVSTFYDNKVTPVLETYIDDIADDIAEDDKENEAKRLELISDDDNECINERLRCIKIVVNKLNSKKESIGSINVYSEQTNRIKHMLKSLNSNMYYEDEISFNNITEYITESDILESTKNELLNLIKNKRKEYLEKQNLIKKERDLRKQLLEQKRLEEKNLQNKNKENNKIQIESYKFNYEDFFDDEDLELIREINNEIYKNIDILNNISQEMVNLIKESLKYKELELDLNSILSNYDIDNYNNIVILYEVRRILEQIRQIFNVLKTTSINNKNLDKYKEEVSNLMLEVNKIYSEYILKEDINIVSNEIKDEKHIIYLKNSSGETLLKNDIKKDSNFYMSFVKMLEDLKNGIITHNYTKDAKYINDDLICKKKHSQSRLVYFPYGNYYIVFLGFIKKSQNNKYEINLVFDRYNNIKNDIDKIIEDLNNPCLRESIVEENDKLHNELITYLKSNARHKKKDLHK